MTGTFLKYTVPIAEALIDELLPFWVSIFGDEPPDMAREVFQGQEEQFSRSTLYLERIDKHLAGTCFIMHSKSMPALAGFGEVATAPKFRGQGIATNLCGQAVEDFRAAGGEAFFLGTVNPVAARIYKHLGWRKLAGANVMVNVSSGASPEEFLVDFFRKPGKVNVTVAGADIRVPMIPLILTPHDSHILDANVSLFSCRYYVQNSCMGLYPRYIRSLSHGRGAFFAARTDDGRVVGLSSARLDSQDLCQVDGFVHHNFSLAWQPLLEAACAWGVSHGVSSLSAVISVEDPEKQLLFESIGFISDGSGENFELEGRTVQSIRLITAA